MLIDPRHVGLACGGVSFFRPVQARCWEQEWVLYSFGKRTARENKVEA